jgi:hypothetical protein
MPPPPGRRPGAPGQVSCALHPGQTIAVWTPQDKFRQVEIYWLYEDPVTQAATPVGTPVTAKIKPNASPYSTPTPQGANVFGMRFYDKNGNVVAVAGGACQ